MVARRSSPSCTGERSVVTLSVPAPRRSIVRAAAGLATGMSTETLRRRLGGRSPALAHLGEHAEQPDVGHEQAADPEPHARRASATHQASPSAPRTTPAETPETIAWPPVSHAARGPTKRLTSMERSAPSAAISATSASLSIITPEPWDTRRRGTPRASASSSTARRATGPSVLGISTR